MNSPKVFSIALVCFLVISCKTDDSPGPIPSPAAKPNILLIIADDMGLDATPGFSEGSVKPSMPNLEALMSTGVSFRNFWSAPVCSPTRATILTGRYGVKTGVVGVGDEISTSETSIQKYLDNNTDRAYSHAVIGKWHLSSSATNPTAMGVGYYAGLLNGGVPSYTNWQFTENGSSAVTNEYSTTKFTDLAIDWVAQQDQPWFLWLAHNAPHTPFHLPPSSLHHQGDLPSDEASITANPLPYYMAAIEAMDTETGRLLSSLSEEDRANTIIIFIGDNGTPNQVAQAPYSRQTAKGSLYQGGVNVPMVISGNGVTRNGVFESALVNSTDLFATIADIAGTGSSQIQDSHSIKDILTSSGQTIREIAYSEVAENNVTGYAIRNSTYKLIVFEDGTREFYNLIQDPYESDDLLDNTLSTVETSNLTQLQAQALDIRG